MTLFSTAPAGYKFFVFLSIATLPGLLFSADSQTQAQQWPSHHRAEAKFRALSLQDENGQIPTNALMNALQQKQQMQFDPSAWPGAILQLSGKGSGAKIAGLSPGAWAWLGPGNIGGRTRSIVIHPTTPTTMWAGTVGGGIWKTLDGGTNWFPLNDFMANLATCCLLMDPTDPNTIYAGTGEGYNNIDSLRGAGIFKTTDGGTTWRQLPSTANSSFYYVNRLAISPSNHLTLLAATGTGIWRSTDGGTNWNQPYGNGMFVVAFNPTNANKCIASGSSSRVVYSTTGGATWIAGSGLPAAGRAEVAYAPSAPDTVYASLENSSGQLYISVNGGASYTLRNTGSNYLGSQGWYDNLVWVDPTNPNILVVGGLDLWRSTDGGNTLTDIGGYSGGIHPDQHVVVSVPSFNGTTSRTIYAGNDGGLFRGSDVYTISPGSSGWTKLNNNLGDTEFYGAAGNATSGTIVGGTQDNGTLRYTPGTGPQGWTSMFGGDGGYCAADPTDPNYFYGEYVYLQIHRSSNAGLSSSYITSGLGDAGIPDGYDDDDPDAPVSANFIAPFILDPNNPNTMLAGGSNLWRSVNVKAATPTWTNVKGGSNTTSFISAIAVAPGNSDLIWVGHNNGDVYATTNGTATSPDWTRKDLGSPNLPNRSVNRLTVDPNNSNIVYACFGGFNSDNVYRTTDGGATWANLAATLPAAPVRSLVIAPFTNTYLYVGTEVGVFGSVNGGTNWSPSNDGGANASVNELFWMGNTLVEATHGRGLFKIFVSTTPVILLTNAALIAENCPPGNRAIDPNETVMVNFSLANITGVPTTNVVATLLATNGVTAPSDPQSFGALVGGATPTTRPFTFTATGSCGGTITPTLQLQDGTNNLGTVSATFQLGQNLVWSENFDGVTAPSLPAGWLTFLSGTGPVWATTSANRDTTPNSVFAGDPTTPSDNQLTSPSIAISSSTAKLTFRHSYSTEDTYDGGVLEISIAGGAFSDIVTAGGSFASNGYTRTLATGTGNALGGRQAWSGSSGGFITTIVNLPPAAAGQSVKFRWRFDSDTGTSAPGWYVDTIGLIDAYTCCSGAYVAADVGVGLSSPAAVNIGSNVTFSVLVTNLGLNIATSVVATDTLPAQLSFVSATASQGTWSASNGVVAFNLGSMSNAATALLTITANTATAGTFTNNVIMASGTSDPVSANNAASAAVLVNTFPAISGIPAQVINEDNSTGPIAFVIGDAETPASALTVSGLCSSAALVPLTNFIFGGSGSNRTVTLMPATNANGAATVTIFVSDGLATNSTSFNLTVNPINDPPVLATIPNYAINEGATLTFTNIVTDPDGPLLTFTLSNAPAGALVNSSSGVFTWMPSELQGPGTNQITVIVNDNGSPNLSDSKTFTVIVNEVNSPPVLTNQSSFASVGLATVVVTNTATDPDVPTNSLTYNLQAAPVNAVIDTNGIITFTPILAQVPSTNLFTTVVTDYNPWASNAQHLSATNSFTVTVNPVHDGPFLPAQAPLTNNELTSLVVTNTGTNHDLPPLIISYQLLSPPAGAAIDTNGIISWIPSEAQGPGSYLLTTVATDNGSPSKSATNSFTVTVLEVNSAPRLASIADQTINLGDSLLLAISATDTDLPPNVLTFSLPTNAPAGASINPTNGNFTWTPTGSQSPSTNLINVFVTDNGLPPLSDSKSFTVTVRTPLQITSISVTNNLATVTWLSISGRTYHLQYKDMLTDSDWSDLPPDVLAGASTASATNGVFSLAQRFYRIVLLP